MNPVIEYLNDYQGDEKTAGIWDTIKNYGKRGAQAVSHTPVPHDPMATTMLSRTAGHAAEMAIGGTLASGVVAGIGHAGMALNNMYGAATKERDFRKMLEFNPDLEAQHKENPKYINASFNTLRNINRDFSKDPMVAGAYVRQVAESPMMAYGSAAEALRVMPPPSPILHATMQAAQQGTRPDASYSFQHDLEKMRQGYESKKIEQQYRNSVSAKGIDRDEGATYDQWHNLASDEGYPSHARPTFPNRPSRK